MLAVGVSACLLGQKVRYDGKDKYSSLIAEELKKSCHLIPVCPEMEIGLGVPRTKIKLTQVGKHLKVLNSENTDIDVTDQLAEFATQFVKQYQLSGLVLQDKSPSCGIGNTNVYSQAGEIIGLNSGVFASTIISLMPDLVVAQANQLQTKQAIDLYLKKLLS